MLNQKLDSQTQPKLWRTLLSNKTTTHTKVSALSGPTGKTKIFLNATVTLWTNVIW